MRLATARAMMPNMRWRITLAPPRTLPFAQLFSKKTLALSGFCKSLQFLLVFGMTWPDRSHPFPWAKAHG